MKIKKSVLAALLIAGLTTLAFRATKIKTEKEKLFTEERIMMGTFIRVSSPSKEGIRIVFDEINRIENLLSKYEATSEVSLLNKNGRIKASPETFYIIKRAKEFYDLSGGAFDITVAPLVDAWGFSDKDYRVPDPNYIKSRLKLVGSNKINLREKDNMIQFLLPGMKIDLGAIAKGYALDRAVGKLKEAGIKSCLINAGGQVYCLGKNFSKPWRVAVKDPKEDGIYAYLEIEDKAVSTSGAYEQNFYNQGKTYGHIMNPKTGYPADSNLASATVITESSLVADALSTAIFILGEEKGNALASKFKDTQVILIKKDQEN